MSESKYGRLFTEADVEKLIRAAYEQGWDDRHGGGVGGYDHVVLLTLLESEDGPWAFPADEPLFLLRGQDKATPMTILHYAVLCMSNMIGASGEHIVAARAAMEAMEAWQAEHPDRVKVPT